MNIKIPFIADLLNVNRPLLIVIYQKVDILNNLFLTMYKKYVKDEKIDVDIYFLNEDDFKDSHIININVYPRIYYIKDNITLYERSGFVKPSVIFSQISQKAIEQK